MLFRRKTNCLLTTREAENNRENLVVNSIAFVVIFACVFENHEKLFTFISNCTPDIWDLPQKLFGRLLGYSKCSAHMNTRKKEKEKGIPFKNELWENNKYENGKNFKMSRYMWCKLNV